MADAPEELCASIFRIEVRKLRCCARDVDGGVTVAGAGIRRDGAVATGVRAGRQDPLRLNFTGGIQQRKKSYREIRWRAAPRLLDVISP
jgi:hypothetical protein